MQELIKKLTYSVFWMRVRPEKDVVFFDRLSISLDNRKNKYYNSDMTGKMILTGKGRSKKLKTRQNTILVPLSTLTFSIMTHER